MSLPNPSANYGPQQAFIVNQPDKAFGTGNRRDYRISSEPVLVFSYSDQTFVMQPIAKIDGGTG